MPCNILLLRLQLISLLIGTQLSKVSNLLTLTVLVYFIHQSPGEVASLGVPVNHVSESLLHLSLDENSLPLHVFHLLFDLADSFLQEGRVKSAIVAKHAGHRSAATTARRTPAIVKVINLLSHDTF